MHELTHTSSGETLNRLVSSGWDVMQDPIGGGHNDVRCTGGWWLYKGDKKAAEADQAQRWKKLKPSIDRFWDNNWS